MTTPLLPAPEGTGSNIQRPPHTECTDAEAVLRPYCRFIPASRGICLSFQIDP